nr:MalY/PatB family protein [Enterococcus timonensis]
MSFNFDEKIDRRKTHSVKWSGGENELPMWVADMDFAVAPAIQNVLEKRVSQRIFGYNIIPETWNESYVNWWETRHNLPLQKEWILFCAGVIPAISSVVRKMTMPGDNVVVLTPVYNIFYNSIVNNQRHVLASPLTYQEENYTIDFADLAEKLARPETTLMIFCNPHNPIGHIWDSATLKKVGDLCLKNHVLLLSDEIHCDLAHLGKSYTPMLSVSEEIAQNTIMCVSPTKTFNLAGLQTSAIIIPNEKIRARVNRGINTDEVAEPNSFAIQAAMAAFNEGGPWLDELTVYLENNKNLLKKTLTEKIPEIKIIPADATYLAWLDCSAITSHTEKLCAILLEKTGLRLAAGSVYEGNGAKFIRWNYACPQSDLKDGLDRFITGVKIFKDQLA